MIVPDAIEPRLGWKALRLSAEGDLSSPSRGTRWPVGERFEATCRAQSRQTIIAHCVRAADPNPPGEVYAIYYAETGTTMIVTSPIYGVLHFAAMPEGHNRWVLIQHVAEDEEPHLVPDDCSCGVYVVDDPQGCKNYFRPSSSVLAEIALWGAVRIGDAGARGQYAYPQMLYADVRLREQVELASERYQVPFVLLETIFRGGKFVSLPVKENM